MSKTKIEVGDRVRYSSVFLGSIFESRKGDLGRAKGVVKELVPFGQASLAVVEWDEASRRKQVPTKILAANLSKL